MCAPVGGADYDETSRYVSTHNVTFPLLVFRCEKLGAFGNEDRSCDLLRDIRGTFGDVGESERLGLAMQTRPNDR
jgi:hypothetical protein